jgi:HKD family nuclease
MNKQIISNHEQPTHGRVIKRLLKQADEVIICAAFLKNSGLREIKESLPEKCTCYIGTDYFLTEPAALRQLLDSGVKLFLTKQVRGAFHPKVYYMQNARQVDVVTGSANITGGGLETNLECSVLVTAIVGSTLDKNFRAVFTHYERQSEQILSYEQLRQYEADYKKYRQKHQQADRAFRRERNPQLVHPLPHVERRYRTYLNDGGAQRYEERQYRYGILRRRLDKLLSAMITSPQEFLIKYEPIAADFYSSDLLRGKTIYARGYRRIIEAVRFIKEHRNDGPRKVYAGARRIILPVTKYGVNAITEIMNVYNPNFSIANGRAASSLGDLYRRQIGQPRKRQFDEHRYLAYNNLIQHIRHCCNAKDLGQVDHFLSWYFDTYLRE